MRTIRLAIVSVAIVATGFAEGDRVNVRGMGMARTYVATSRGLDAVGINPATLALEDDKLTVSLAPLGVHAGSDFLTLGLYNDYFTGVETGHGRVGKYLDDADKQRILDAFRGGVGEATADASVRLLGISYQIESVGGFAFTITDQVAGSIRLPSEYVRFLLYGNTPGSIFDFSQTKAKVSWLREYALSFGGSIPHPSFMKWLALGAAMKLVDGFGYYEVVEFNTSLETADNGILTGHASYLSRLAGLDPTRENSGFSASPFGRPAYGHGSAFDLGLAGGITDYLTVGLSITDIGKMNWESQIEETYVDTLLIVDDPQEVRDGKAIENSLKGKKRPGAPFSSALPTTVRLGVALEVEKVVEWMPGQMILAADYNKGIADAPGTTLYSRFSLGMEWKLLSFLPLRTGISFGGTDRSNYALGFGLRAGFFDLDVATENLDLLWSGESVSHASFAVGTRFRF